jgi:hypothetical protein
MLLFLKITLLCPAFLGLFISIHAQEVTAPHAIEVRGSGRVVQEQRKLKPFKALKIEYTVGNVVVEVGGTTSAFEVQLDDNLRPFINVKEVGDTVDLSFRNGEGAPVWAVDASVKIIIKTPTLMALVYKSNGTITITGLSSETFSLANQANGRVMLSGKVNSLALVNIANGSIGAENVSVQQANVILRGNGTVRVNAKELNTVKSGAGSIINVATSP